MSFYPVVPPDATLGCAEDAALGLLGQAGMVAVRVADLACPARRGLGRDGRTALTAAGAGRVRSGDLVVWLKPVAVAPAVVRRDGRVQAAGHPADHARLGVAEQRLDELCGVPGVIDQVARSAVPSPFTGPPFASTAFASTAPPFASPMYWKETVPARACSLEATIRI